jgi:hypothetical protein
VPETGETTDKRFISFNLALPNSRKPFVKSERESSKMVPDFDGELASFMFLTAFPTKLVRKKMNLVAPADWAFDHAIRPSDECHELEAYRRIFKVLDRLQERSRRFHDVLNLTERRQVIGPTKCAMP